MNDCHGPCQQGRYPCPCPEACESPDDPFDSPAVTRVIGIGILAALALFWAWVWTILRY